MDATPHGRRRRRALADADGEHSDGEIDKLLQELGVPTSDSKKQGGRRSEAVETPPRTGPAEVIELLTPPASPRGDGRSSGADSVGDGVRTPMDGGRRASIVDLTSTPSPASTGGLTAARVATVVPLPADPRRRSAKGNDNGEATAVVNLDLDGGSGSDSDDAYNEIFATGLRRVAREPPPAVRSSNRPLDFSLPVAVATASSIGDARTPPPKKRKRLHAFHSPAAPTSTAQLGSPAPSTPVRPAPSPGRGNASKPTAASTSNSGSTTASISARLERSLDESEAGRGVRQALQTHVYNGKQLSVAFRPSFDCKYPRVIMLDLVAGTSSSQRSIGSSNTTSPTTSCVCAVYFDAHAYLQLLLEEAYAGLTTRVEFLTRFVAEKWYSSAATCDQAANPQVFVIVEKMDHALVEYKKNARKNKHTASRTSQELTQPEQQLAGGELPDISFANLHEVAFQLFMDLGAHTKFTCDSEASASYVAMIAREMVVSATRKSSEEEFLESVPRLHSFRVDTSGVTVNNYSNSWLRMLQTIPGVSEDKAQSLMDHFPTFESLMRAYRDSTLTQADKEDLLTDKLHRMRFERALSKRIYTIFTSMDPTANVP